MKGGGRVSAVSPEREKSIPIHTRHAWARVKNPNSCFHFAFQSQVCVTLWSVTQALELMTPKDGTGTQQIQAERALESRCCKEVAVFKNLNSWLGGVGW